MWTIKYESNDRYYHAVHYSQLVFIWDYKIVVNNIQQVTKKNHLLYLTLMQVLKWSITIEILY